MVCRNLKQSIGIITFKSDHEAIKIPVMPDSLQVSPAGDRSTVVVVSLNRMFLYVSRDFGKKWNRYNTPVVDFDPTEELYLSSFHPQHMVVRSQGGEVHREGKGEEGRGGEGREGQRERRAN